MKLDWILASVMSLALTTAFADVSFAKEEAKKEEVVKEAPKVEEKKEEAKKDEAKKEEVKKDDAKKEEAKAEEKKGEAKAAEHKHKHKKHEHKADDMKDHKAKKHVVDGGVAKESSNFRVDAEKCRAEIEKFKAEAADKPVLKWQKDEAKEELEKAYEGLSRLNELNEGERSQGQLEECLKYVDRAREALGIKEPSDLLMR